jgi:hypothetical protein
MAERSIAEQRARRAIMSGGLWFLMAVWASVAGFIAGALYIRTFPARKIKVRKLELVDADEDVRMSLGNNGNGSMGIWFFDKRGQTRAVFAMDRDSAPGLALCDPSAKARLYFSLSEEDLQVVLCGKNGQGRLSAILNEQDAASVMLRDEENNVRVGFRLNNDGTPYGGIFDETGNSSIEMSMDKDGLPSLAVYAKGDSPSASLCVDKSLMPDLSLAAREGESRITLGFDERSKPTLSIRDQQGKPVWKAPS